MRIKDTIRNLLEAADYQGLLELSRQNSKALRLLISMTYDKADPVSWRAMEAIGEITATMPEERVRNTIQRVLWMMREESGTNPWSAGEIIGEIVRKNPAPFEDIVPIVISFHEEAFLRASSLWAMQRIAEVRPDLVKPHEEVAVEYLKSGSPAERAFSILALGFLGNREHLPRLEKLFDDNETVRFYRDSALIERTVGDLAREAFKAIDNNDNKSGTLN